MQALNKSASYRSTDRVEAELTLVGMAGRKSGKARCAVSLPLHRENKGEVIAEAWEIHPKRARKLEGATRCDASRLDLIIEEQKGGQPLQGHQFGSQGAVPAGRLDCPFRSVDGFRHLASLGMR